MGRGVYRTIKRRRRTMNRCGSMVKRYATAAQRRGRTVMGCGGW